MCLYSKATYFKGSERRCGGTKFRQNILFISAFTEAMNQIP